MTKLEKVIYTARADTTGGRDGGVFLELERTARLVRLAALPIEEIARGHVAWIAPEQGGATDFVLYRRRLFGLVGGQGRGGCQRKNGQQEAEPRAVIVLPS
jgi:hypothetical protein